MTPAENELARALDHLAESLKHPTHAAVLDPIRAKAKAVMARFFKRQRALFVREFKDKLHTLGRVRVAEASASDESKAAVLLALPDSTELPNAVTSAMAVDYAAAVTAALTGGYDTLAADLSSERAISADVTAAYLRERSLEILAKELEPTTVKRIQTALADAYEAGEDYDGLVSAVRDEFAGMADGRAGTLAQTGMNSAYNQGRKQLGKDLGFDEKSWNPDGSACAVCMGNVDDGWIGIDESFSSGDDAPCAHQNCDCSLDVRASAEALAA